VANNGMAAAKCIMSIRRWAFLNLGDEQAIQFVAMARGGARAAAPGRRAARARARAGLLLRPRPRALTRRDITPVGLGFTAHARRAAPRRRRRRT
jgi:hypothetical protein